MFNNLLKIRFKWFHLRAWDFILRYQMGLIVLVMFLPGVAIGDNFILLFLGLTKPFQYINSIEASFALKFVSLLVLQLIFMVWSKVQKIAIDGGNFSLYLQSLPIDYTTRSQLNGAMLLYANHFLYPLIIASFFFLAQAPVHVFILSMLKNLLLILLLFCSQYLLLFKREFRAVILLAGMNLLLLIDFGYTFEWFKVVILLCVLGFYILGFFVPSKRIRADQKFKLPFTFNLMPRFITANFHFQILFKSFLSSTLFRLLFVLLLISGFVAYAQNNFIVNSGDNDLLPYALVLEALIAYYLSGFFVSFTDTRRQLQSLLRSLPVKFYFWPVRDIFMVVAIAVLFHGLIFIWVGHYLSLKLLFLLLFYQILLLLLCYPIRVFVIIKQTYFTFTALFIVTAITIYNSI